MSEKRRLGDHVRVTTRTVGELLLRYAHLKPPQGTVIEVFLRAVAECCGVVLRKNIVTYRAGSRTVGISVAGSLRQEIILHKKQILTYCAREMGVDNAPKDIV